MRTLFTHIKELVQVRDNHPPYIAGSEMANLPKIKNAYLLIEDDKIKAYGKMENLVVEGEVTKIDVTGRIILPSWCDSHTHLVYAGNREGEFVDRINGLSYKEIADKGGGILNSARKLAKLSEAELYEQSRTRLEKVMRLGTGAIEIKTGYGLTVKAELKMLRVIRKLQENYDIPIKATFLGAHALPAEYKNDKQGYLNLLVNELMPKIAEKKLAEYVDIFCETGYFTTADTAYILEAGQRYGLTPKIHVNQFTAIGGVQTAVTHKALSVDHLEVMRPEDIECLVGHDTMPVALPGCSYFLNIPYTPAREIIKAGLPIALATDYNPGSCPSGNMNFIVATACIKMKMTPEETINAATLNAAYAMGLENELGSITVDKWANFIITKPINSYASIPYAFGDNPIESVYLMGKIMA